MDSSTAKKAPTKKFGGASRKTVGSPQRDWVRLRRLSEEWPTPIVIEPNMDGIRLAEWADANRDYVESLWHEHRALLFRGFEINTVEKLQSFVKATSDGKPLQYRDRTTPRTSKGEGTYTSTVHPADQRINLHNEGTYWLAWALKIYFCCRINSDTGGETPLADVRRVYDRIDPDIRSGFEHKQWALVRNYNDGFGLPWQDVFQTNSRDEVEQYCAENQIELEWKDGDRLRTRQVRPAVRLHPRTGEPLWFNHCAFFHYTTLEPAVQEALLKEFGVENLPYNTEYGDGTPVEPGVVEHLREAYEREKVVFRWEEGDVTLLDNMTIAHAREPYTGSREVLVSMTDAYRPS